VVYYESIAFNYAIHGEVASIAGVRDLSVFETFDGYLDCIDCRSSSLQNVHG